MKKNEVLEVVKGGLNLESKKEAENLGKQLEELARIMNEKLPVGEKAKFGGLIFEKKHVPERRGISTLGEKKEWVKPAHDKLTVKLSVK